MKQTLSLFDLTRDPIQIEMDGVYGQGRANPRLVVRVSFRTLDGWTACLLNLRLRLFFRNELLGDGWLSGIPVAHNTDRLESIEIPVSHRMIQYVTDSLGTAAQVDFETRWAGMVRVGRNSNAEASVGDPTPGAEVESRVSDQSPIPFQIARSSWYANVLATIRQEEFLYLEIAIPQGTAAADWQRPLSLLADAEKAYAQGDPTSVFTHLRGVHDSLPGAKQHIFDALPEPKRGKIDDLLKSYGNYLHAGRHVATAGPLEGTFPVDNRDAVFALAVYKTMLSYASHILTGPTP